MLVSLRIEVESRRIRDIASRIVRHNRDVITYLALVRIAFRRIKRIAHSNVSRPGEAGVSAKGIK